MSDRDGALTWSVTLDLLSLRCLVSHQSEMGLRLNDPGCVVDLARRYGPSLEAARIPSFLAAVARACGEPAARELERFVNEDVASGDDRTWMWFSLLNRLAADPAGSASLPFDLNTNLAIRALAAELPNGDSQLVVFEDPTDRDLLLKLDADEINAVAVQLSKRRSVRAFFRQVANQVPPSEMSQWSGWASQQAEIVGRPAMSLEVPTLD